MIQKLKIQGFGPFREQTYIKFQAGITYIYGDNEDQPIVAPSNGTGKTSILNAISVLFFGKTPKGSSKNDLINHTCDEYIVEGEIDKLWIKRSKSRKGSEKLEFKYQSKRYSGSLTEVQPDLEEYLGMDFDAFCNTCFISSDSKAIKFLTESSSNRMKILEGFIDDISFQEAATRIQGHISSYEKERDKQEFIIQEMVNHIPGLRRKLEQSEERLQEFERSEKERKKDIVENIKEMQSYIVESTNEMKTLQVPTDAFAELEDKRIKAVKCLRTAEDNYAICKNTMNQLASPTPSEARCPTCYQPITEHSEQEKQAEYQRLVAEATALEDEIRIHRKNADQVSKEMQILRDNREKLKQLAADIEYYKRQIALLKDDLQSPNTHYLEDEIKLVKQDIEKAQKREEEAKNRLVYLKSHIPFLRKLKLIMSNEVRSVLLDELRYTLCIYVNNYIRTLANNEFKIDFPSPEEGQKDKFDVTMISGGHKQAIENYSGGESWKAQLAFALALRRYAIDLNVIEIDWILIDDPAGELDPGGMRQFIEMLEKLLDGSHTKQIVVTLPCDLEARGHTIRVTRKDRVNTVEYTKMG